MAPSPTVLLVYYSRTGTTAAVADTVVGHLDGPTVERLRPRRQRGYLSWLLRTIVPGSPVAIELIEPDPGRTTPSSSVRRSGRSPVRR